MRRALNDIYFGCYILMALDYLRKLYKKLLDGRVYEVVAVNPDDWLLVYVNPRDCGFYVIDVCRSHCAAISTLHALVSFLRRTPLSPYRWLDGHVIIHEAGNACDVKKYLLRHLPH